MAGFNTPAPIDAIGCGGTDLKGGICLGRVRSITPFYFYHYRTCVYRRVG